MSAFDPQPASPARFADDDLAQLRLLSVFHYVVAGMMALVALLPALYLVLGLLMATGRLAGQTLGASVAAILFHVAPGGRQAPLLLAAGFAVVACIVSAFKIAEPTPAEPGSKP